MSDWVYWLTPVPFFIVAILIRLMGRRNRDL